MRFGKVIIKRFLDKYTESDLNNNSNIKVLVECSTCGEESVREYSNIKYKHSCSSHIVREGQQLKWCSSCHSYHNQSEFGSYDTYDQLGAFCSKCQQNIADCDWNRLVQLVPNLTSDVVSGEQLRSLYINQSGICPISGKDLYVDGIFNSSNYTIVFFADIQIERFGGNLALVNSINFAPDNTLPRLEVKIGPNGILPYRKRSTDAGYDLFASEDAILRPMQITRVDTDISVCAPHGYYYHIEGRSSLLTQGIWPLHATIDATYNGPLFINLMNVSPADVKINRGDRIAQIILHEIRHADFATVDRFTPVYDGRQQNGLGSTGK